MTALESAAAAIRKNDPSLREAQSFARAMAAHPEIAKIEREAAREALHATTIGAAPVRRTELSKLSDAEIRGHADAVLEKSPDISDEELFRQITARARRPSVSKRHDDAMDALRKVADDLRKRDPSLTVDGAFVKAMRLNPALAKAERLASREALYSAD
jgi:hypothetical protein